MVNDRAEVRVFVDPPVEREDGGTDKDSDDSDNPEGVVDHLPRRILGGPASVNKKRRASNKRRLEADSDEEGEGQARQPRPAVQRQERIWNKTNSGMVGSKVPEFIKPVLSADYQQQLENISSGYDYYKLFQPDSFANEIVSQSRLYALQKGYTNSSETVSQDTYRCTEAMLLHSGYHSVPRRRMMWETKQDCHINLVADNIRRYQVAAVLQCLHFRDNSKIDADGYYKVRSTD